MVRGSIENEVNNEGRIMVSQVLNSGKLNLNAARTGTLKKSYIAPKIVRYGTLNDLTRTVDNSGATDGGMGSTDKT